MSEIDDFAAALEGSNSYHLNPNSIIVKGDKEEVYVDVDSLSRMADLCAMASDYGLRPHGIIKAGASRFRPHE